MKELKKVKEYQYFILYVDEKTGLRSTILKADTIANPVKIHSKNTWERKEKKSIW